MNKMLFLFLLFLFFALGSAGQPVIVLDEGMERDFLLNASISIIKDDMTTDLSYDISRKGSIIKLEFKFSDSLSDPSEIDNLRIFGLDRNIILFNIETNMFCNIYPDHKAYIRPHSFDKSSAWTIIADKNQYIYTKSPWPESVLYMDQPASGYNIQIEHKDKRNKEKWQGYLLSSRDNFPLKIELHNPYTEYTIIYNFHNISYDISGIKNNFAPPEEYQEFNDHTQFLISIFE